MLIPRFIPLTAWFLTIISIGNLSFHLVPEGFLVPFNLKNLLLGFTLNLPIGGVYFQSKSGSKIVDVISHLQWKTQAAVEG